MKNKLNSIIKSALSYPLWGDKRGAVLLLLAIIFTFTTCKRYPEGGWSNVAISHLFGVNETDKVWKLKLYEVNGIDSTEYIISGNAVTSFENDEIRFQNFSTNRRNLNLIVYSKIHKYIMEFTNKKKTSFIVYSNSNTDTTQCFNSICERNLLNPERTKFTVFEWKILRLKKHELIITSSTRANVYKIILNN